MPESYWDSFDCQVQCEEAYHKEPDLNTDPPTHGNGPLKISHGDITAYDLPISSPAMIADIPSEENDLVTVLKYGSKDKIKPYYQTVTQTYRETGLGDMAATISLLEFSALTGFPDYDRYTGAKLSSDEICTLMNWLMNHIRVKDLKALLSLPEQELHEKLKTLSDFGF